jgi:hypothetical protein
MEKDFVTYEQALVLKELGFDEPCIGWYNPQVNYKEVTTDRYWAFHLTGDWENFKPAPLYQQAFRWFREKYGLSGLIEIGTQEFSYQVFNYVGNSQLGTEPLKYNGTYEEAEQACLDKLIEIIKNKQD